MPYCSIMKLKVKRLNFKFLVFYLTEKLSYWNMQLRSLASPNEIAQDEDIVRIFLMACEVKNVKLSVIGLSCLQKLISHDAVAPSALNEILSTLKEVSYPACTSNHSLSLSCPHMLYSIQFHPSYICIEVIFKAFVMQLIGISLITFCPINWCSLDSWNVLFLCPTKFLGHFLCSHKVACQDSGG